MVCCTASTLGSKRIPPPLLREVVPIPPQTTGDETGRGVPLRPGKERNRPGVDLQADAALVRHLAGVPEQPEAGDIGRGVDAARRSRRLGGGAVEGQHRRRGGLDVLGARFLVLERGGDDAGADRLGQEEDVARERAGLGPDLVGMDRAGDDQPELRLGIGDGVPAGDDRAGLGDLLRRALEDGGDHVRRQVLREPGDIEREEDRAAHGVDVAHAVGGGDGAVGPGVVDDRGEEIDRLHDRQIGRKAIDRGVVAGLETDDEIRVGGEGQRTQHLRQGRRAQFGRSASAAGERGQPYLVSGLHGVVLTIPEIAGVERVRACWR